MSGFSDAQYKELTAFFQEEGRQLPSKPPYYAVAENMTPSVWFRPTEVIELKNEGGASELNSLSSAGVGDQRRGSDD